MNKNVRLALMFVGGALTGGLVTAFVLKKENDKKIDELIDIEREAIENYWSKTVDELKEKHSALEERHKNTKEELIKYVDLCKALEEELEDLKNKEEVIDNSEAVETHNLFEDYDEEKVEEEVIKDLDERPSEKNDRLKKELLIKHLNQKTTREDYTKYYNMVKGMYGDDIDIEYDPPVDPDPRIPDDEDETVVAERSGYSDEDEETPCEIISKSEFDDAWDMHCLDVLYFIGDQTFVNSETEHMYEHPYTFFGSEAIDICREVGDCYLMNERDGECYHLYMELGTYAEWKERTGGASW